MSAFLDILSGKKNIFEVLISQKKRDEIKTNLYVAGIAKELPKSVQKRIDEERKQIVYKGEEREKRIPKREPIVRHDDVNDTDVVEKVTKIEAKPRIARIIDRNLIENVKEILTINKIEYTTFTPILGCRSTVFQIKISPRSVGIANRNSVRDNIAIALNNCTVSIGSNATLIVTVTDEEFEPIYVESFLHKLKNRGEFLIGEVNGEVMVENILKMNQAHVAVSGGSNSGKSYFLNAVAQSLLHSTPNGRFWFISPKKDHNGGDFEAFSKYNQAQAVKIIGTHQEAHIDLLKETLEIINKLKMMINQGDSKDLKFLFIDEMAYFLEVENIPKYIDDKEREDWELLNSLKSKVLLGIKDISQRGRAVNIRMILGTQVFSKEVFGNQILGNMDKISFRASKGDGVLNGFNKASETLLTKGDGLYVNPKTSEVTRFQSLLATP